MLSAILLSAAVFAQTPPPPPAPAQTVAAQRHKQGRNTVDKQNDASKKSAPDAELIGFLGDYEDAADGLDPIGLAEQRDDQHKGKDGGGQ